MANLYGVFWGYRMSQWVIGRNKRDALRLARQKDGEVRVMKAYRHPDEWDGETFYKASRKIS